MMVCVAIPNQVYAAGKNKEAALTVEQTVKGKTNGVTDEFQYELTSLTLAIQCRKEAMETG